MANISAIEKAIQEVVFNNLEESFIPCKDKSSQESIRVMTYSARNKLPQEYKDLVAITKTEEDGMLFVKVYKRAFVEIWVRDKVTGKLVPSTEKLLSPEEIKEEEYKAKGVKELNEPRILTEEIKPDFTKLLVNPEKWDEVKVEERKECVSNLEDSRWMEKEVDVRRKEKEEMMKATQGDK